MLKSKSEFFTSISKIFFFGLRKILTSISKILFYFNLEYFRYICANTAKMFKSKKKIVDKYK